MNSFPPRPNLDRIPTSDSATPVRRGDLRRLKWLAVSAALARIICLPRGADRAVDHRHDPRPGPLSPAVPLGERADPGQPGLSWARTSSALGPGISRRHRPGSRAPPSPRSRST